MNRLLERSIDALSDRLVLLAPCDATSYDHYENVDVDASLHDSVIRSMQRFRGAIYLADGAIRPEQLTDGMHRTPEDERSWHLLLLDEQREVAACVWYLEHDAKTSLNRLRARSCPLAVNEWRDRFRHAITSELSRARAARMKYSEVGGWAVRQDCRHTGTGLILALSAYALGRIAGGALGLTTATTRHGSAQILRRLGGAPLQADQDVIPPYFDTRYGCEMELLRFDSRRPSTAYARSIDRLVRELATVPVVASAPLLDRTEATQTALELPRLHAA